MNMLPGDFGMDCLELTFSEYGENENGDPSKPVMKEKWRIHFRIDTQKSKPFNELSKNRQELIKKQSTEALRKALLFIQ